jgi:hypothetical protein
LSHGGSTDGIRPLALFDFAEYCPEMTSGK